MAPEEMVCGKAKEVMSCFSEIFPFCSLLLWPFPSQCERFMHEAKRDFPLPFRDVRSWAEVFASVCHSSNLTPSLGGLTKSHGVNSPRFQGVGAGGSWPGCSCGGLFPAAPCAEPWQLPWEEKAAVSTLQGGRHFFPCPALLQPWEAFGKAGSICVAVSHQQSGAAAAGGAHLELGFLWDLKKRCVSVSHIIILLL